MKDLRRAYNMAWEQAEKMGGDFQDCLLHCLSKNLGMPILNEVRAGSTDDGMVEQTANAKPSDDSTAVASQETKKDG